MFTLSFTRRSRKSAATRFPGNPRNQRGVALVMVLLALVLLSILVVSILVTSRQEVATSAAYNAGGEARLLSDSAVNLVIGQIASATSNPDLAWISQPGLIRTFSAAGQQQAFKLYSSNQMVAGSSYNPGDSATTSQEVPADWYNRPDEYVDLNRPIQFQGRSVYPIVDPGATAMVEGFSFDASGVAAPASMPGAANVLPMPVRWIYVATVKGTGGAPEVVFLSGSDLKAETRPIQSLGRIAFWTDDETSKVNINTACGGVFYDSPGVFTKEDHMFGRTQPVAQEYQRWPGHPSTTSLSPVLKPLRDISDPVARSQQAAALAPRIGWGGSMGGTDYAWWDMSLCNTDMDRFYASPDELAYSTGSLSGGQRTATTIANGGMQISLEDQTQKLDQLRFFMTANSRAPELNLFNRPRVTIWPFNQELVNGSAAGANSITPEDKLIQFASELGGVNSDGSFDYTKRKRFYFQRKSAWDPDADWRDVAENRALFYYLQSMTAREIPSANPQRSGTGNSFFSKYGSANRDQILTGIWDYARSQVNTINLAYQPVGLTAYSFPQNHNNTTQAGFTDIAPLRIQVANTKGTGRFPVLTEVILQFVNLGEDFERDASGNPIDADGDGIPDNVIRKMRMVLLPVFQMPVNNLYGSLPRFQIKITGASQFQLTPNAPAVARNPLTGGSAWQLPGTAVPMGFPTAGGGGFRDPTCYVDAVSSSGVTRSGNMGFAFPMTSPVSANPAVGIGAAGDDNKLKVLANRTTMAGADDQNWANSWGSREDVYYPFVSDVIEIRLPQKNDPAFNGTPTPVVPTPAYPLGKDYATALFSGGTIDITIYPGLADAAAAVSPINGNWQPQSPTNYLMHTSIAFGPTTIPLPRLGPALTFLNSWDPPPHLTYADMKNYYARLADERLMNVPRTDSSNTVPAMDVFRSYSLSGTAPLFGDLRVAALTRDIPSSWWQPSPLYNTLNAFYGMSYFPGDLRQWGGNPGANPADGDIDYLVPVTGDPPHYFFWDLVGETGRLHASISNYSGWNRTVAPNTLSAPRNGSSLGDFSNGYGNASIGALIVGPDIGAVTLAGISPGTNSPYYDYSMSRGGTDSSITTDSWHRNFTGAMFSPFKQIPSPVIFGGLSSRAATPEAWETLLFCPNPAGGKDTHRGWSQAPRDHFLLDLFYMPVVEPYAITENFSTAGKINLNSQIAPFSYIKRQTGIYALLDGMTSNYAHSLSPDLPGSAQGSSLVAVPISEATSDTFRSVNGSLNAASSQSFRKFVDTAETLKGFENRFSANDPFVSESEICEMFLVPQGNTIANVENFWKGYLLTGDDKREMPYNHLYPRVTTRSNTFRVHFWVQTLSPKMPGGSPIVTGEYRGSTIVERYLDVNLADYGTPIGAASGVDPNAFPALSSSYRFRKIDHHQFAP